MSARKSFISYTSPFTSVLPLDILTALTGHHFIIPFYHIVSDQDCPHIRHLYSFKGVKAFEKDLDYLASAYKPIGAADLEDVLAGKYKGKKIMLLTFDDGLRQMYDVVAPILLRKGVPAVFFLNNDFIDNKGLMFRYKTSLMKEAGMNTGKLFTAENEQKFDFLADEINVGSLFDDFLRGYKPYMTESQIKSLVSQGFAIGGHSLRHPFYRSTPFEEQLHNTYFSIEDLQKRFGVKEKLFAFPFTDDGVTHEFFDKVFEEGRVDFTFGGAGIKNDVHPRQYQRIPMEGWAAGAEQTLKSEYLYYLLRMPLMKNTIKR